MLSQTRLEQICRTKCDHHNVNTDYFLTRLIASNPANAFEATKVLDNMMADAFFNNYEEMYSNIKDLPSDYI